MIRVPLDFPTIQGGIHAAVKGDTVLVEPGRYRENLTLDDGSIVLASWYILSGNPTHIHQTIIDGERQGSVITIQGSDHSSSVIRGFTLTGGLSNSGGGIFCINSAPIIADMVIADNEVNGWLSGGGGIYLNNSDASLENVHLTGNLASLGGGIFCSYSQVSLQQVKISKNEVRGSSSKGGGIFCGVHSDMSVDSSTITGNISESHGGGIYAWTDSRITLDHTEITDNSTNRWGSSGGAFYLDGATASTSHMTMSRNRSEGGAGIFCGNARLSIVNSIIWEDQPVSIACEPAGKRSEVLVGHSILQGGMDSIALSDNANLYWLEGNESSDPGFFDPDFGDFTLNNNSAAIDRGLITYQFSDWVFVDHGLDDFKGQYPDIGAWEYNPEDASGIMGDLNQDDLADVGDIVRLVDLIMQDHQKSAQPTISADELLAAADIPAGIPTDWQAEPFSTISFQLRYAAGTAPSDFQEYWQHGNGVDVSMETPFYLGRLEAGVQLNPYFSQNSSIPDFNAGYMYLGWGLEYPLHRRLNWFTYGRIGNLQMAFDDQEVIAALRTESEFSTSIGTRFSTPITRNIYGSVSVNYQKVHTQRPIEMVFLAVGFGYSVNTPNWIRSFLN